MSALDIAPPSAPGVPDGQKGFFGKLFKKKEPVAPPADELSSFEANQSTDENFNLDDIREKLGLEEQGNDMPPPSTPEDEMTAPETPSEPAIPPPPEPAQESAPEIPPFEEPTPAEQLPEQHEEPPAPDAPVETQQEEPIAMEASAAPELAPPPEEPKHSEEFHVDEWSEHDQKKHEGDASEWVSEAEGKNVQPTGDWAEHDAPVPKEPSEWTDKDLLVEEPELPDLPEPEEPVPEVLPESFEEEPEQSTEPEQVDEPLIEEETENIPEAAKEPAAEPSEPVEFDNLIGEHFTELEKEHEQLDQELQTIVKHEDVPSSDHPYDRKVPADKEFVLKNGVSLKSLRDLLEAMELIDQETFDYHVTEDKNDFAAWLKHVFEEEQLAEQVRNEKAKEELLKILKAHEDSLQERFNDEEAKIDEIIARRQEKLENADGLQVKLESLQQQLKEKSEELAEERKLVTKGIEERLNAEVDRQVAEEQEELHKERQEAVDTKREYENKLEVMERAFEKKYEKREARATEREEKIQALQESLKKLEETLNNERAELDTGRQEAEALLAEAQKAEAEVKAIHTEREKLAKEQEKFAAQKEKFAEEKKKTTAIKTSVTKQEKIVKTLRDKLNKREQELTKQEAIMKKELADLKQAKSEFTKEKKAGEAARKKEMAQLKNEQRKLDNRRKKAEEAEARLEEKLQERRKIAQYVEDAERSITEHEKRMSNGGMRNYLKDKLADVGDAPSPTSVRNLKIYTMIDQARQALSGNEVAEARNLYNKIRERFNKEQLSPHEKQVLYTTIRELYDDIQMANLK